MDLKAGKDEPRRERCVVRDGVDGGEDGRRFLYDLIGRARGFRMMRRCS